LDERFKRVNCGYGLSRNKKPPDPALVGGGSRRELSLGLYAYAPRASPPVEAMSVREKKGVEPIYINLSIFLTENDAIDAS